MKSVNTQSRLPVSLLVYVVWIAITILGGRLLSSGKHQPLIEGVSHGIAWNIAAAAGFLLIAMRVFHWHDLKFVAPNPWRSLRLLWLPALYVLAFLSMSLLLGPVPASTAAFLFANTLIVGFSEETMFRGVIFEALRSRVSLWSAIIVSSLLFGAVHVLNVFATGELLGALIQATTAAMSGLAFVALLVRTGSIWPPIIYHALWDFGTFMMSSHTKALATTTLPGTFEHLLPLLLVLPHFLYALYLLRNVRDDTRLTTDTPVNQS